jgi:hypothetical protein
MNTIEKLAHKGHNPTRAKIKCSGCPVETFNLPLWSCDCGAKNLCASCMIDHLRLTYQKKRNYRNISMKVRQERMKKQTVLMAGRDDTVYKQPITLKA